MYAQWNQCSTNYLHPFQFRVISIDLNAIAAHYKLPPTLPVLLNIPLSYHSCCVCNLHYVIIQNPDNYFNYNPISWVSEYNPK